MLMDYHQHWLFSVDVPSTSTSHRWYQHFEGQLLNIEVNCHSTNSRLEFKHSKQESRPQTLSILLTSPEPDLADADPPSPAEDFQTYEQLMVCMAKFLDFQIHRPTMEPVDHLYDPISKDTTTLVHISVLPSLLSTAQRNQLMKPASSHSMSKYIDNLYWVRDPGTFFSSEATSPELDLYQDFPISFLTLSNSHTTQ